MEWHGKFKNKNTCTNNAIQYPTKNRNGKYLVCLRIIFQWNCCCGGGGGDDAFTVYKSSFPPRSPLVEKGRWLMQTLSSMSAQLWSDTFFFSLSLPQRDTKKGTYLFIVVFALVSSSVLILDSSMLDCNACECVFLPHWIKYEHCTPRNELDQRRLQCVIFHYCLPSSSSSFLIDISLYPLPSDTISHDETSYSCIVCKQIAAPIARTEIVRGERVVCGMGVKAKATTHSAWVPFTLKRFESGANEWKLPLHVDHKA